MWMRGAARSEDIMSVSPHESNLGQNLLDFTLSVRTLDSIMLDEPVRCYNLNQQIGKDTIKMGAPLRAER